MERVKSMGLTHGDDIFGDYEDYDAEHKAGDRLDSLRREIEFYSVRLEQLQKTHAGITGRRWVW